MVKSEDSLGFGLIGGGAWWDRLRRRGCLAEEGEDGERERRSREGIDW